MEESKDYYVIFVMSGVYLYPVPMLTKKDSNHQIKSRRGINQDPLSHIPFHIFLSFLDCLRSLKHI